MKTSLKLLGIASLLAMGAVALSAAQAGPGYGGQQGGPGYGMGPGSHGAMMAQQGPRGMGRGNCMGGGQMGPAKTVVMFDETWAANTKTALGITADQDPAWTAYVTAVKDRVVSMQDLRATMTPADRAAMTPAERQETRDAHWATRDQLFATENTARTALVDQLDDRQKLIAGAMLPSGPGTRPKAGGRGGPMMPR
ncbi:MAG: Spy/CpxP family protein refolding chaperone [Magnetospiraceae bacterium]